VSYPFLIGTGSLIYDAEKEVMTAFMPCDLGSNASNRSRALLVCMIYAHVGDLSGDTDTLPASDASSNGCVYIAAPISRSLLSALAPEIPRENSDALWRGLAIRFAWPIQEARINGDRSDIRLILGVTLNPKSTTRIDASELDAAFGISLSRLTLFCGGDMNYLIAAELKDAALISRAAGKVVRVFE
jgi:hypothetical protein